MSLSYANACLTNELTKPRPLIGDSRVFTVPNHVAGSLFFDRPLATAWPAWNALTRARPYVMTLDAALLPAYKPVASWYTDLRTRYLPVVQLRHYLAQWIARWRSGKLPAHRRSVWTSRVGPQWLQQLGAHDEVEVLERGAALFLTTYERTVCYFYGDKKRSPRRLRRWKPFLEYIIRELGLFRGLPHDGEKAGSRLVQIALWRTAFAAMLPHWAMVHEPDVQCAYPATLFGDTHLDLIAAARRYAAWDEGGDDFFFFFDADSGDVRDARLLAVYPLSHRVLCAEELPDLVPFLVKADVLHDHGRSKKSVTLDRALMHLFLRKLMNQKCHIHHLSKKAYDYVTAFPEVIGSLLRLSIMVGLLGNLPRQKVRLRYAARVRVQLDMAPDPLGPTPTEPAVTRDRLLRWLDQHRHAALFLMREYCLYTCERDAGVERVLAERFRWRCFVDIVRHATCRIREEISRQCERDFAGPINWAPIDIGPVHAARKGLRSGDINRLRLDETKVHHRSALTTTRKVMKGWIESMLPRKMTPTRSHVLGYHVTRIVRQSPLWSAAHEALLKMQGDGRTRSSMPELLLQDKRYEGLVAHIMTRSQRMSVRDAFADYIANEVLVPELKPQIDAIAPVVYAAAWAAVQGYLAEPSSTRSRQVIQLRWLQLLPLTKEQIDVVREWVYSYYVLDCTDNSFLRRAILLGQESLLAHIVIHYYFRWVHALRTVPPLLLSANHAARQLYSICERLGLLPYETLPPEAGKSLYCDCCGGWATPFQEAPPWIVASAETLGTRQNWEEEELARQQKQRDEERAIAAAIRQRDQETGKPRRRRNRRGQTTQQQQPAAPTVTMRTLAFSILSSQLVRPEVVLSNQRGFAIDIRNGERYCDRGRRCGKIPVLVGLRTGDFYEPDFVERCVAQQQASEEALIRARRTRFGFLVEEAWTDGVGFDAIPEEDEIDAADEEDRDPVDRELAIAEAVYRLGPSGAASIGVTARTQRRPTRRQQAQERRLQKLTPIMEVTTRVFERLTESLRQHHGLQPQSTCWEEPLRVVDLVGVWYMHRNKQLVGLCVYCGVVTPVRDQCMTNRGLSCMHHPHYNEFPLDHPQSLAWRRMIPQQAATVAPSPQGETALAQTQRCILRRNPWHCHDPDERCALCGKRTAVVVIYVFDVRFRAFDVPICRADLSALAKLFPAMQLLREDTGRALEPIPLHLLWEAISAMRGRQARATAAATAATTTTIPATPSVPDPPELSLEEQVKRHPNLQQLLRQDPSAMMLYRFVLHRPAELPPITPDEREKGVRTLRQRLREVFGY